MASLALCIDACVRVCVCKWFCVALFRKSKSAIKVLRSDIDDNFMPHIRIVRGKHPTRCTHTHDLVQCSRCDAGCRGVESSKHWHLPCTFVLAHMVSEFQFGIDWTGHLTSKRKCTEKSKDESGMKAKSKKSRKQQPKVRQSKKKKQSEINKNDKIAQRTKLEKKSADLQLDHIMLCAYDVEYCKNCTRTKEDQMHAERKTRTFLWCASARTLCVKTEQWKSKKSALASCVRASCLQIT